MTLYKGINSGKSARLVLPKNLVCRENSCKVAQIVLAKTPEAIEFTQTIGMPKNCIYNNPFFDGIDEFEFLKIFSASLVVCPFFLSG